MTWRRVRILAALLSAVLVALFIVVQTGWFRNYARQEIISLTEDATGGKVDLNAFDFDVWHLHATLRDFTIHGSEPPDAAPFLRVAKADAEFRLLPGLRHLYQIAWLTVENPRLNVMELADGRTNIPSPRRQSTSNTSALQTVVDLAVGRFELTNGEATLNDRKEPLDIRANNLVAQLSWNAGRQSYQGQLSLQPLYVVAGRNTPVIFTVRLPLSVERDRIEIQDGAISTPVSTVALNVSLENMRNPKFSGRIAGSIALTDLRNLTNLPLATETRGAPRALSIDVNATASWESIAVSGMRVSLGDSSIAASGMLKDPAGRGSLAFKTQLALGELSRLLKVSAKPEGLVLADGNASLRGNTGANAAWNYLVTGNMEARNVSFQQGTHRVADIHLSSTYRADPHAVELNALRLTALGGEFTGHAALQDFEKYKLDGNLRNLNLQTALRTMGEQFPYDALISGPVSAEGDTRVPGTKSLSARAALSLEGGRRGIPVSGRLNANFSGVADTVTVTSSYLNLPHTKITLNGSVNNQLNFSLTSRDLNDLLAAASLKGPAPVALNGGELTFNGSVTGRLSDPRIAGSMAASRFSVEGRQFDSLNLDLLASSSRASIANANLTRGPMQTHLTAAVGLKRWTASPYEPVAADASIANGDLADIAAMAGQPPAGFSGALSASVHITGTVGNPQGTANLQVTDGTIAREPFNQLQAQVKLTDRQVTIPTAFIQSAAGRVNLTAEFSHPPDSFTTGRLHAHLQSDPVNLAEIRQVQEQKPAASGTLQINADVTGDLSGNAGSEFLPISVTADAQGRGLRLQGLDYGNLDATARTSGQTVAYNLTMGAFTSTIRLNGNTGLTPDYPTTADANINNISIDHFLSLANRKDLPARGSLSGTLHVDGTAQKPHATANLDLSRAVIYGEPVDNIRARGTYLDSSIEITQLEVVSGPARIALTGRYDHPAGNLEQGDAHFDVTSSQIDVSRIRNIQKIRPGFGGVFQINAGGGAQVRGGNPKILLTSLNARVSGSGIKAQGKDLGDLTFTANTNTSSQVNFNLDSDLGGSSIRGRGTAELMGDYRVDAQLTFANVLYSRLQPLLSPATGTPAFEVATDGEATVKGPIFNTDQLGGSVQLSRLSVTAMPQGAAGKPITISNQGPIAATLDRGVVRIQSARVVGPSTDISAAGTASLTGQSLNLTLNANADLGILPNFDRDIYSSGKVVVAATVGGNASAPRINGQMTLQNAAFNYTGITNGISNANGVIAFNGNNATIRNLTGESGGGKIALSGFIGYASGMRFGVTANAKGVRMRAEQGVGVTTDADLRLTGTIGNSLVSGSVTIDQLTYNPQSDIGSILSRAAPPVQSPSAPSPLLDNMRLEVRVRSSTGVAVQASLAQNLRADVDLRVRGTAALPAVLGRISISEGQLVFFGSSYTVDNGTIAFYNPVRIEPMLDIALETQAQSVHVTVRVTGPIDNMKLSYTSDPPLQFQEIVSLLAAGKTPTSDPTLLANQPQTPQQSFQQMGESAIVSKALADPVSSRLERVFGVTQLKIDPAFQTGSQVPTARLTLQQQISSNLTFTYTSALDDPNGQIVKIEWAFSPRFSAIANRDQNGIFSINFFYKRSFR